jgi:hypothetical protein
MPPQRTSDGYLRFHVPLIFDVQPDRLVELVETDANLQAHLKRHGIDFGWDAPTWEEHPPAK